MAEPKKKNIETLLSFAYYRGVILRYLLDKGPMKRSKLVHDVFQKEQETDSWLEKSFIGVIVDSCIHHKEILVVNDLLLLDEKLNLFYQQG